MECIFTCPTCGWEIVFDNEHENEPNCPRCPAKEPNPHHDDVVKLWKQVEKAWKDSDLKRATQCLLEILLLRPIPEQVAWKNLAFHPDRVDVSGVPEDLLNELPVAFSGSSSAEECEKRRQLVKKIQKYVAQPLPVSASGANSQTRLRETSVKESGLPSSTGAVSASDVRTADKSQDAAQRIIKKQFERWEYHTVKELDQLCSTLPVLSRTKAMAFFDQAGCLTKKEIKVAERQSGEVFESLSGIVSSSDREDFTVTYDLTHQNLTYGILMLETYDDAIGVLFCVARIAETSFITHGFTQSDKLAIKGLRNIATESTSLGAEQSHPAATSSVLDTIEVEAKSLDAAKEKLRSKLSNGLTIISEAILSEGKIKIVEESSETTEKAFTIAMAKIPADATIEKKETVVQPERNTLQILAEDEKNARDLISLKQMGSIESVSLTRRGRRGFLGIGKTPNTYDVVVFKEATVKVSFREKVKIRAKVGTYTDKFNELLREMTDSERVGVLRHGKHEELYSFLKVLMVYSEKIDVQTELAVIDLLGSNSLEFQKMAIDLAVSKDWIPAMAMKIAFELRERELYQDEMVMPLNQLIQEFNKTPELGKAKAESALEYIKSYPLDDQSKATFEERFKYFTRDEPTISPAELAERTKDKTLCHVCGKKMAIQRQGPYFKLRCESCDITRFEESIEEATEHSSDSTTYVDGDIVKCENCQKKVEVKMFESSKGQAAVVDPNEIQSLALRCQNCGFVTCFSCAVGPSNEGIPICPSCKEKGAPYFFMR